jgi:hypothetical protein
MGLPAAGALSKPEIITKHIVDERIKDKYRLLVAEDNLINRKVIAHILEKKDDIVRVIKKFLVNG